MRIRYSYVKKKVLSVIRALKKFRHLLSHNKVQLLVSHATVKDFLLNKDINEKRAGWITRVMEYDVEIKVSNLVKGRGLCEQMISALEGQHEVNFLIQDEQQELQKEEEISIKLRID